MSVPHETATPEDDAYFQALTDTFSDEAEAVGKLYVRLRTPDIGIHTTGALMGHIKAAAERLPSPPARSPYTRLYRDMVGMFERLAEAFRAVEQGDLSAFDAAWADFGEQQRIIIAEAIRSLGSQGVNPDDDA